MGCSYLKKQPKPIFHVGDRVEALTFDLWGKRLIVKSVHWSSFLGYYEYILEDEKGNEVYRGNGVPSALPEHFLKRGERFLQHYIRVRNT